MTQEFKWSAKLIDGTVIDEIDKEDKEHLFKEVIDRIDDLRELKLFWDNRFATVNLETGHFNVNGEDFGFEGLSDRTEQYRPIYFKRVKRTISNIPGLEDTPNIKYHIGYQITIDGKNYQRVLQIDNLTKNMEFLEKNIPDKVL